MANPVVIATGGANLASLLVAIERLGHSAQVSVDAETISGASHVFLPGVGAAKDAMLRLDSSGLSDVIRQLSQPVLGICLGMQLLYEGSAEDDATCLGLIPGEAKRFSPSSQQPVPQMGWNTVRSIRADGLTAGIGDGEYCYFIHSYALPVSDTTLSTSDYGCEFTAIVRRDNFCGTQFHPERSSVVGARLLHNFLSL